MTKDVLHVDPSRWPVPTWAKLAQDVLEEIKEETLVNMLFDEVNEIATAYSERGAEDELLDALLALRDRWAKILADCKCDHIRATVLGCPVHGA